MSKTQITEQEQIDRINARPDGPTEFTVPSVNIGGVSAGDQKQVADAANFNTGDTSGLDALDQQFLANLSDAIKNSGVKVDLSKFDVRSLKELVGYPGGSYINWTVVFTHQVTRKVLRSDAFLASRGNFWVLINELDSISR